MASLPKRYNSVITSLLVGKTIIALQDIVVALIEVERFMKQGRSSSTNGEGLVAQGSTKRKSKKKVGNPDVKC